MRDDNERRLDARRPARTGRAAGLVAAVAVSVALAGCGVAPASHGRGGGPVNTEATNTPTVTAAATPTIVAPGAHEEPSTGGVRLAPTGSGLLDGKVIAIDPGHNSKWVTAINMKRIEYFGAGRRPCQNAGSTALDKTVSESNLVWDIANRVVPILRAEGATVVLTRPNDTGVGPCNDERAEIANRNKADLLVSIHGDGNESQKFRGFFVIHSEKMRGGEPVAAASTQAAKTLVDAIAGHSRIPISNYIGSGTGMMTRNNELAVLNTMETGPAVLLEVGNIIQTDDWAILSSDAGKDDLARGIAAGAKQIVLTGPVASGSPSGTGVASATPSVKK